MLGRAELARYRALESMLPDPALADPNPARSKNIPPDQASFLESLRKPRAGNDRFPEGTQTRHAARLSRPFPDSPAARGVQADQPRRLHESAGRLRQRPDRLFFHPTYNPQSKNFYIRAAIEDPRPILGHEGIPGHFLQLSIANHVPNEIRRQHDDGVFIEGWALYGEEMLMRTGLYPENSAAQGQILRLSRYRSARIGVDVNLHTGQWTFEQAVQYFMEAGGLDREAAEGEAAGAASDPTQKIWYIDRQMADHEFARPLSRQSRAQISSSANSTTT